MSDPVLLCYCTCPDADVAGRIARALVDEQLAACVNCVPGVTSTYRWGDGSTTGHELLLLIKTVASRLDALKSRLLTLHPYDLPELIAVPVTLGSGAYLDWVRQSSGGLAGQDPVKALFMPS